MGSGFLLWKRLKKVLRKLGDQDDTLATATAQQQLTNERVQAMSQQLDALTAQVKANNDLAQSAVALIQGLAAKIEALKDDPVKLQQLADDLKANDDTLAAAVQANTPAVGP